MLVAVAPVLQITLPVQSDTCKVTVSVAQIFVLLAVMVGIDGNAFIVITTELLAPLSPQVLLHVAV
jgi:hypothetical protein